MKKISYYIFRFIFIPAFILVVYGGCKNTLDINADYKDVLVCYGLLDPHDSVQYVRIDKVFLGEGNALVMAQNNDTISFAPGRLDVKVERWYNGNFMTSYQLYSDTTLPRDSGLFVHPYQVLYRGTFPVLKDGSEYKIVVKDLVKGTTATSITKIPGDVTITDPVSNFMPLNLWDTTNIVMRFKTGVNGYRYRMILRFHYTEQFVFDTTQTSQKYVDWYFTEQDASSNAGNLQLEYAFERHTFFNVLKNLIHVDPMVHRITGKVDLIFVGATDDVATYMNVATANSNSAADLPPFSNISGGYGLFAARTTTASLNYWLDQNTVHYLYVDPVTQPLDFIR
ncbi:MAG: DUF4249 family protein [Bacteroidetes bacterium]|nr:DUF4249 family protein [Bacteroidota bacterium]